MEKASLEHDNKGLYFSVEPFALTGQVDNIDDAKFEPLGDECGPLASQSGGTWTVADETG